jgi:hypothetical protein
MATSRRRSLPLAFLSMRVINEELAMAHRLHWLLIALSGALFGALFGGCSAGPGTGGTLPDPAEDNLALLTRSAAHPCGADVVSNGQIAFHDTYTYDALGRAKQDREVDTAGKVVLQTDYTWDNAGHLTEQVDSLDGLTNTSTWIFDTLGRNVEFMNLGQRSNGQMSSDDIKHTEFDELDDWLRGEETLVAYGATTPRMRIRSYAYDQLGRQISFEVRDATDVLTVSLYRVYDDKARTITETYMNLGNGTAGSGQKYTSVSTYDANGHLISDHEADTDLDGTAQDTIDTTNHWSGDRQLSSTMTFTFPDGPPSGSTTTYKYECRASNVVGVPAGSPGSSGA